MVWARLDDAILDNDKIAQAGVFGFALHVAGITWCCRNLTDGFIPDGRVACLLDWSSAAGEYLAATGSHPKAYEDAFLDNAIEVGDPDGRRIADTLVAVGLWRRDDDRRGYWIHDFLEYNPSRSDVLGERAAQTAKKSAAGKKGAASRWQRDGKSDGTAIAPPMAAPKQSDGPEPVPVKGSTSPSLGVVSDFSSPEFSYPDARQDDAVAPDDEPSGVAPRPGPPIGPPELELREAYTLGIARGSGAPWVHDWPPWDRQHLALTAQTFARTKRGEALRGARLLTWMTDAAHDFAEAMRSSGRTNFYGGLGPRGFARWLGEDESKRAAARERQACA